MFFFLQDKVRFQSNFILTNVRLESIFLLSVGNRAANERQGAMILNTSIWQTVITTAKAKASNSPEWLRAIDRAVVEIEKSRYWSFADGVLTIRSVTTAKLYRIGDDHACEARNGICKHRAARRLMQLYFEALRTPAPPVAKPMAQRQAERDKAVLVKPSQYLTATKYGGIDI